MESNVTPYFRMSYPNLFKARKNEMSGEDEFSVVALFPKGCDLSVLKQAAKEAIEEKWGKDPKKWPKGLRSPFRDQAEKEREIEDPNAPDGIRKEMPAGYEKGAIFINLKSKQMPGIVGPDRKPIIDPSAIYAGAWARASVRAYAYETKGNKGVSFALNNVQKWKDDEPLSGRRKAEDEFEPIEGVEGEGDASTVTDPFA